MNNGIWFDTGTKNSDNSPITAAVYTPKDYLAALKKWTLVPGQEAAIGCLAEVPFDTHEGTTEKARSIGEYRAFLAKGWTPIKPSDIEYRLEILKSL